MSAPTTEGGVARLPSVGSTPTRQPSSSSLRADAAVAHEILTALEVPPSPSVAVRVSSLGARLLDAEAEVVRLRAELARLTAPEVELLRAVEREARRT